MCALMECIDATLLSKKKQTYHFQRAKLWLTLTLEVRGPRLKEKIYTFDRFKNKSRYVF